MQHHLLHSSAQEALDSLVDRLNAPYNGPLKNDNEAAATRLEEQRVKCLLVCTSDGVPLTRSFGSASKMVQRENGLSEAIIRNLESIMTTFVAISSNQLRPIIGGEIKTTTAFYCELTLQHVNAAPLVLTFVGGSRMNVGTIQSILPKVLKAIEPLRMALHNAQIQEAGNNMNPDAGGEYNEPMLMGHY